MQNLAAPYFSAPDRLPVLRATVDRLRAARLPSDSDESAILHALAQIIDLMLANPWAFDQCLSNIQSIAGNFFHLCMQVNRDESLDSETLQILFALGFRFICEIELLAENDSNLEVLSIKNFAEDNIYRFNGRAKGQIIYAQYSLPVAVLRTLINNPSLSHVREYLDTLKDAEKLKNEWDKYIATKKASMDDVEARLSTYHKEYNFVGLVDGFRRMTVEKKKEKSIAFWALMALAVTAIGPLVVELFFFLPRLPDLDLHPNRLIFVVPALVTLEFLLVYFFRVVLAHFRSIKAQLLQLDLRCALCQFVENYTEFAGTTKKAEVHVLEKFESVIFSGLLSTEEALPSTFDGMEQIVKLIQASRGK